MFSVPEEDQQPLWPLIQKCNVSLRDSPIPLECHHDHSLPTLVWVRIFNTQSPELLDAFARYGESTSPPAVSRVLEGLHDGADLSAAAGLREAGWSAAGNPIEELVEYLAFDFIVGRRSDRHWQFLRYI